MEDLNFLQNMYIVQSQSKQSDPQVILESNKILPPQFSEISLIREDIFHGMVGRCSEMKQFFESMRKIVAVGSPVLITGSIGTGKRLAAKVIHDLSSRTREKKIDINCASIEDELLESKLLAFGKDTFKRGAGDDKGLTLFLDRIDKLPPISQKKLLKVLPTEEISPVGGANTLKINIQIIASADSRIQSLVETGEFDRELYDYLRMQSIHMPDLKDRNSDIPILILFLIFQSIQFRDGCPLYFNEESMEALMSYDWPGNIDEMQDMIKRLAIFREEKIVKIENLPVRIQKTKSEKGQAFRPECFLQLPSEGISLKEILSHIESSLITQALERTSGNKNRAARLLNINRTTLIEKMKKKNISLSFK